MGVYQAAGALGLAIPDDVSVVGFDDQELISDSLRPGLTTVALPHYEMGQWAVRTLLEQIEAEPPYQLAHALMPCPIIRRGSVAAPPTAIRTVTAQPNGFPYRQEVNREHPETHLGHTASPAPSDRQGTYQRRGHPLQRKPLGPANDRTIPTTGGPVKKNRIIKGLAATIVVATLPFALTSCAKGGSTASNDSDAGGTKTISMWTHNAGNKN